MMFVNVQIEGTDSWISACEDLYFFMFHREFYNIEHISAGYSSKCKPRNYIFYLKTHKTGSSTMASIFFRYGDARNLTFVLPRGPISFSWPNRFHLSATIPLYAEDGKILTSHTRYNKAPVNLLFPKPKSKYITILRFPVNQFESVFEYYQLSVRLGLKNTANPIETFLKNPTAFTRKQQFNLLRNPSMFDLGFDKKHFENRNAVTQYIKYIENEFDLVLINEYFDESLILLKNLLCWDLEDILYIKQKVRRKRVSLNDETKANILSWSHADLLLYNHFNTTLWRKISEEGPRFFEDLQLFRKKNNIFEAECLPDALEEKEIEGEREKVATEYSQMCAQMTRKTKLNLASTKRRMQQKWKAVEENSPENGAFKEIWEENHELKYKPLLSP